MTFVCLPVDRARSCSADHECRHALSASHEDGSAVVVAVRDGGKRGHFIPARSLLLRSSCIVPACISRSSKVGGVRMRRFAHSVSRRLAFADVSM